MKQFKISAQLRDFKGSASCNRKRKQGVLPGVLYGANGDNMALSFSDNELSKLLEQEAFYSNILSLEVNGTEEKVVLKALQRHPSKPTLVHIDFLRIDENKAITMHVPLHFLHEDKCIGIRMQGGISSHIMNEVEVLCLPKDLPEYIEIDMQDMNVGDTVHMEDLKLPQNVELNSLRHGGDATQPVVSVYVPKVAQETEAIEAVTEEEAAGEEEKKAEDETKE
ncbi:MAG: 50S ribosomal protein L25/general stress protein Ctc [Candidatus Porifericomitaceae bacterium WSBS_2022_MAG_OTU9]